MPVNVLMLGDAMALPGRAMYQKHIPKLIKKFSIDFVIANGENSANDGKGITSKIMESFKHMGIDVVTTGNHIWRKRDVYNYLSENKDLLRPANYPSACPGVGYTLINKKDVTLGVMNLQGRAFMRELIEDPLKTADSILTYLKSKTKNIIIDFHAETTAEKAALAYYLDGRVSAVVGTHTHVQTSDERVLPRGTAFITDLGMAGAVHSSIGMRVDSIIKNMLTQMPTKHVVETEGSMQLCGVIINIDTTTGKANSIKRVKIIDDDLKISY